MITLSISRLFVSALYVAAAGFCAAAALRRARGAGATTGRVWWWLAVGLIVLTTIRQFQVLAWITDQGRQVAVTEGWYWERRSVQGIVILAGAVVVLVLSGPIAWRLRRFAVSEMIAIGMFGWLVALAILQLISLHQVDAVLNRELAGARFGRLLEVAGAIGLGLAAFAAWRAELHETLIVHVIDPREIDPREADQD